MIQQSSFELWLRISARLKELFAMMRLSNQDTCFEGLKAPASVPSSGFKVVPMTSAIPSRGGSLVPGSEAGKRGAPPILVPARSPLFQLQPIGRRFGTLFCENVGTAWTGGFLSEQIECFPWWAFASKQSITCRAHPPVRKVWRPLAKHEELKYPSDWKVNEIHIAKFSRFSMNVVQPQPQPYPSTKETPHQRIHIQPLSRRPFPQTAHQPHSYKHHPSPSTQISAHTETPPPPPHPPPSPPSPP